MGRPTFKCCDRVPESGCPILVVMYRSCGVPTCKLELAYCKDHGGDARCTDEMVAHINAHKEVIA